MKKLILKHAMNKYFTLFKTAIRWWNRLHSSIKTRLLSKYFHWTLRWEGEIKVVSSGLWPTCFHDFSLCKHTPFRQSSGNTDYNALLILSIWMYHIISVAFGRVHLCAVLNNEILSYYMQTLGSFVWLFSSQNNSWPNDLQFMKYDR